MIISGTNISAFGMKLLKVDGLYNLPSRKKTTEFREQDAVDMVNNPGKIAVSILGRGYADLSVLTAAVNGLKTLIQTNTVHEIQLVGHGETFNGTFADGFQATPYIVNKGVVIKADITIVQ